MFFGDDRKHWWLNKSDVFRSIFEIVEHLDENQVYQREANLHHLRLYSNKLAQGLNARAYALSSPGDRLRLNVIRSVVDAAVAHIATNRPRPEYLTIGGDFTLRQRAESLGKFINGQFYATDQYAMSLDIFRDAAIFGTGIEKIYEYGNKIHAERVFPNEILVDDQESMMGDPRSIYQHKEIVREVAASIWPQHKDKIEDAAVIRNDDHVTDYGVTDMISCVEAWHLPSTPGAKDGRHVICISNETLVDEPWERDNFPFAIFRWQKSPLGFWGSGIAEELSSIQVEINYIAKKIQDHFTVSAGQMWMKKGSGVPNGSITNKVWAMNTYRDAPPTLLAPTPVNPMFLQYLDTLYGRAFQQVGLSEMAATSIKPAGLNSGQALRTYNDIGSKRFMHVGQNWERFHLAVAEQMNETARKITKKGGGAIKVLAAGDKAVEQINFKEVSISKDMYTMQCAPVGYLEGTPAGKIAALRELAQVSPEFASMSVHLLDIPDLDKIRSLINAPLDIVDKFIERILKDGEFRAPDPMMNLDLARQRATLALLRAEVDNTPTDRVELLRRWIVQVDDLQALAEAPPPMPPGAEGLPPDAMGLPPEAMGAPPGAEGLPMEPAPPGELPPGALPPGLM